MMTGQLADAQHYLDEGMRREPDSALGHFLLGSLDIKIGRFQQAEAALRQTIQLSPTMAQARLQLMNLMLQQGRNADAVSELQQFVTTFPDSPYASKARELLHRLETPASASARSK
jgi:predicted Zn-dependent protease